MTEPETSKISVRLYSDDLEYLRRTYDDIGYNYVIRLLVRKFVKQERNNGKRVDPISERDVGADL